MNADDEEYESLGEFISHQIWFTLEEAQKMHHVLEAAGWKNVKHDTDGQPGLWIVKADNPKTGTTFKFRDELSVRAYTG